MPILVHHEFTFGDVPCVVMTTSEPPPIATLYVIVGDGYALRPLVDNAYLQMRFGPMTPPDAGSPRRSRELFGRCWNNPFVQETRIPEWSSSPLWRGKT